MKHCPSDECPYHKRHGVRAEYQDSATACSDCGTALVEGGVSTPAAAPRPRASAPWGRLAVSVGCGSLFLVAAYIPLPGTEPMRRFFPPGLLGLFNSVGPPELALMAIGLMPILYAAGLVEFVAILVPSWRHHRIGGYDGRARLRPWFISLAALLSVIQASSIALYLRSYQGRALAYEDTFRPALVAMVLLPLGTLFAALLAAAISRWGLGDGYSVLIVSSVLPGLAAGAFRLARLASAEAISTAQLLLLGTASAAICLLTARALLGRVPFKLESSPFALELPPSGIDPLISGAAIVLIPSQVAAFLGRSLAYQGTFAYGVVSVAVVASLGIALSILYNQPRRVAQVWFGQGAAESATGSIRKHLAEAAVRAAALLAGVELVGVLLPQLSLLEPVVLIVGTAVVLDVHREWCFRREHPRLAPAWPVQRVYAARPALKALEAAGIPAFPRGLHHRTLLQFFGPYVPVTLLVPEERVAEAAKIVQERLQP